MKAWLLLSRFDNGGLERVQLNLAQALRAHGIDTQLISGQVAPGAGKSLPSDLHIDEIAQSGKFFFLFGLLRALRSERPDVVFTTSNDVACLMVALRLVFFRRIRVVVVQHLSLSGPRLAARGLKRTKLDILRIFMKLLLPHANRIVSVSHAVAADMRRELSLRDGAVGVIHNPIITANFHTLMQEEISWPWADHDQPTIVFVGRIAEEKRLDLLLEAFQALSVTMPIRLLVVGSGPLSAWLEGEVRVRQLDGICKLIGFHANPLPWIKASDVLVLSSDYEGFGNVLVEAMACGTQVISTDCPDGPAEILNHGQYGQLVPRGDAKALAVAIQRSLTGAYAYAPEALVLRASEFGVDRAANAYADIIREGK